MRTQLPCPNPVLTLWFRTVAEREKFMAEMATPKGATLRDGEGEEDD